MTCDILHCDNLTDTINNSVLANDCSSEFGSVCRVECNAGYRAVGNDNFTCDNVNDTVEWRNNANGGTFHCVGKECNHVVFSYCIYLHMLCYSSLYQSK